MNSEEIFYIVIGIVIGLGIAYLFLWGRSYSKLNSNYNELNNKYIQLNSNYNKLQQNYTLLQTECSQVLKKYKECAGREDFFNWVNRFLSIRALAGLVGLI